MDADSCFESFASIAGDLLRQGQLPLIPPPASASEDVVRERLRRVVHEIGNPLAIIQNYLATLKAKYAQNNLGTRELGIVSDEIGRLTKILDSALQDSGAMHSEVGAVKLNPLIENLVVLCRSSGFVAKGVDIRTELFADPPELLTDSDRFKQLLLNLLKNAVEAMPGGGIIRVGTAPWGNGVRPTHIEIRIRIPAREFPRGPGPPLSAGIEQQGAESSGRRPGDRRPTGRRTVRADQLPLVRSRQGAANPAAAGQAMNSLSIVPRSELRSAAHGGKHAELSAAHAANLLKTRRLVVVDDDDAFRMSLCDLLHSHGYPMPESCSGGRDLIRLLMEGASCDLRAARSDHAGSGRPRRAQGCCARPSSRWPWWWSAATA